MLEKLLQAAAITALLSVLAGGNDPHRQTVIPASSTHLAQPTAPQNSLPTLWGKIAAKVAQ